jgi:hypothetical protein
LLDQVEQRFVDAAPVPVTMQAKTTLSTLSRYGPALAGAAPGP